jgi:hypothetical protein
MKNDNIIEYVLIAFVIVLSFIGVTFAVSITKSYERDMVNMSQVTDFEVNGDSLTLYTKDGSYYYWER